MRHFIIGLIIAAISGGIVHYLYHDIMSTLLVGGGVAVLYWLIVAACKSRIKLPDLEFPDFGD